MNAFAEHLKLAKGSVIKARRTYVRERRWSDEDWFRAWQAGLASEVESAVIERKDK
jgi:hypothetical protein